MAGEMRPQSSVQQSSKAERIAAQVPHVFPEPAEPIHSDVQGSYTGDPLYDEQPVQDADDL